MVGEGERARRSALADAEAIEGAKRGEAEQRRRTAVASAVETEGNAEAAAILARGTAEAQAMDKRAEAFNAYGEAAVLDLLVKVLPQIVEAASAPLSNVDKISIISTEGASDLTKSVASNVAQALELSGSLTGVDVRGLLSRLGGIGAGAATGSTAAKTGGDTNGRRPHTIAVTDSK